MYGAASMDAETRRRLAAEYANAVVMAPPPIKAALVYGLIVLRMARRLAVDVVREIAWRDDPVAHQIMVYTLSTEGETILAVDGERWSRLVEASEPVVREYRMRAEAAMERFARTVEPPSTLHEARKMLRKTLVEMVDATFKSRDAVETILHLLAVRQYLGAAFGYATAVGSDVAAYFPRLVPLVFRRARRQGQGAPKALVLEVCEKLEPLDAVQMYLKQLEFTWTSRPRQAAAKKTEAGSGSM